MAAWRNYRPWLRQPPGQVAVDLSSSYARGLSAVWVGNQATNLVTKIPAPKVAGTVVGAGAEGLAARLSSSALMGIDLGDPDALFDASECTIAIFRRAYDTTARNTVLFGYDVGGASDRVLLHAPYGDGNIYWDFGTALAAGRLSTAYTKDTSPETLVVTAGANVGREIWRRGIRIASAPSSTATRAATVETAFGLGYITGAGAAGLSSDEGEIYLAVIAKRVWTPVEIANWCANPWRIFAPLARRIPAPAIGVRFDSVSNSGFMGASADYTFARTVAGTDRFLVVDVAVLSAGSNVVSVTDDSGGANAAMTLIASRATGTGSGLIESWGRIAPATGTKNIRVQLSTAVSTASSAANYTGVHQTAPTEAVSSNIGTNATPTDATVSITPVAAGTWIHAALATNDNSCSSADRRDSIADMVGGSLETMDTRGAVAAATAREMRVTDLGGTAAWTILGFAIRPNTAAGGGAAAPVGIATETDAAIARGSARPYGISIETDSALALAGSHLRATGLSAEADSALNLGAARPAGFATETDSALALGAGQSAATGLALETDSARSLGVARPAGFSTETDSAFALNSRQIRAVGLAVENDSALPLAGAHLRAVGIANESDTAIALNSPGQIFGAETDTAFALAGIQRQAVGLATETDSVISLTGVHARTAGVTSESDTAFALASVQRLIVGVSAETDTALARPAGSTGGGANPADVWNYVMANGQTAEMNLLALLECCQKMMKIQTNKRITDPVAGTETLFDNDNLTVLLQGALFEDAAGVQRYRGQGAERRDRMV